VGGDVGTSLFRQRLKTKSIPGLSDISKQPEVISVLITIYLVALLLPDFLRSFFLRPLCNSGNYGQLVGMYEIAIGQFVRMLGYCKAPRGIRR